MRLIDILNNTEAVDGFRFSFRDDNSMCIRTELNGRIDFLCEVPAEVVADLDKQHERGSFEWSMALDLMDVNRDGNDIWHVLTKSEIQCSLSEFDS